MALVTIQLYQLEGDHKCYYIYMHILVGPISIVL